MSQLIDPRAPRIGAAVTSLLAILGFTDAITNYGPTSQFLVFLVFGLFVWSVFFPATHPYKKLFQLIRPRLSEPSEMEDSRPPHFAQQVGLGFATFGLIGFAIGSQAVVAVAFAFIFVAAFLNAFFDFCLGCQMYLLLKRAGLFRS